jgi:zinc finger protein 830
MSWGNYPVNFSHIMSDVRTLLQREREARRIQHPHLSYSKSGALTCTVCSLNIKSEALWEGHLKSANHRKNLQIQRDGAPVNNGKKRKIDEVEEENPRKRKNLEDEVLKGDTRKKREVSFATSKLEEIAPVEEVNEEQAETEHVLPGFVRAEPAVPEPTPSPPPVSRPPAATVDEDEWAAFSAEVAPLVASQPSYTDATISAAPISATELAAQQQAESRSRRDMEVEDEKEESEQRLADEFDVMEEMEERVRRLKEKREALRTARPNSTAEEEERRAMNPEPGPHESDSDDEEVDDWYS